MDYSTIFNKYITTDNRPFALLSKSVVFPSDMSLPCYDKKYIDTDIPWTILSYQLYKTIEHWWILASLNRSDIF